MKYFLIKADPIYATAPDIRNWFGEKVWNCFMEDIWIK